MNSLTVNPTTGFLDADNWNSFTSDKKIAFLQLAEDYVKKEGKWPDIGGLCDKLDIDVRTLERHLKADAKFNEEFKALTTRGKWKLESLMFDLSSKNPMYCFGWLRKWFPEEYNPAFNGGGTVNNVSIFVDNLKDLSTPLKDASIRDVELVDKASPSENR